MNSRPRRPQRLRCRQVGQMTQGTMCDPKSRKALPINVLPDKKNTIMGKLDQASVKQQVMVCIEDQAVARIVTAVRHRNQMASHQDRVFRAAT